MTSRPSPDTPCAECGHAEDDHDGYGGLCDGLGWNSTKTVCGCTEYVAPATEPAVGGKTYSFDLDTVSEEECQRLTGLSRNELRRRSDAVKRGEFLTHDEVMKRLRAPVSEAVPSDWKCRQVGCEGDAATPCSHYVHAPTEPSDPTLCACGHRSADHVWLGGQRNRCLARTLPDEDGEDSPCDCSDFTRPVAPPHEDPKDEERKYPCDDCGKLRTKAEGGTVFTVCDECWPKNYPPRPSPAPVQAERKHEFQNAVGNFGAAAQWCGEDKASKEAGAEYDRTRAILIALLDQQDAEIALLRRLHKDDLNISSRLRAENERLDKSNEELLQDMNHATALGDGYRAEITRLRVQVENLLTVEEANDVLTHYFSDNDREITADALAKLRRIAGSQP